MARPAPAAARTTEILDFLAANPGRSFSLSELSRRLDINKASAHAICHALCDAGYLVRHPTRKDYSLGPATIAVGQAARGQNPVLDFARDEMGDLAVELDLGCFACGAMGDEIVILDRAGHRRPFGVDVAVGHRVPLVPPLGTVFVAWSPPEEIDEWLRRVGSASSDLARYREAVAAVRARGYSVSLAAESRLALGRALGEPDRSEVRRAVEELAADEYLVSELEPSQSYRVSQITAPVFDANGTVALALSLVGFQGAVPATDIPPVAVRLTESADRVTKAVHGRHPDG
jgi:DNA-binding IclR family transcriptional regulator